ncbi:alpha/beta hydrolase [Xinfangfangia sp. CPCC 101601]|uniref:Alpha/beta hydrolase n=1 Tax=Pseudogemmobacter lacusdianii TaxID=3069608 RepID=A0ABU0VWI7_9RHOB|nr:alpha/beta fold hydrolase [Xinfangfangia sp. CPCC 101601]MDQ2065560.1 alpha/beta hydrolase [Xinfangfangia sp. CPCC 101601]
MRELQSGRRGAALGEARAVVIFLHGYGADGADLLDLADAMGPQLPGVAFYAPDAPEPCRGAPYGRQWFPIPWIDGSTEAEQAAGLEAAVADLNAFIDKTLAAEGLEGSALALLGFSQGAMMSMHVAPRRDRAIAGVVAISGRLMAPERLEAEAKVKPPVLLVHGDRDDVVPFQSMQLAANALVGAGFETFGHVMQGTGHGIAPDGLGVALQFLKERLPQA